MGQYYKPVIINSKNSVVRWWYSHDCKFAYKGHDGKMVLSYSGLKLMEHSWRNSDFVGQVVQHLENNPQRLVWAGDYADIEKGQDKNLYDYCTDKKRSPLLMKQIKVGDSYQFVSVDADKNIKYAVNHTKKQFVDFNKIPKDNEGWQIHALPLLTCEGNGRGGGDYREDTIGVGDWARDLISTHRKKTEIPKGFKEILPLF